MLSDFEDFFSSKGCGLYWGRQGENEIREITRESIRFCVIKYWDWVYIYSDF